MFMVLQLSVTIPPLFQETNMKPRSRKKMWACLLLASLLSGCGSGEESATSTAMMAPSSEASGATQSDGASARGGAAGQVATGALVQAAATTPRKIIYTATVDAVVENLSTAQAELVRLVKRSSGYIAETNVGGQAGDQRTGTWKVRVPVEQYESFMAGATRLGELRSIDSKSQDVTAEFYDVAARISNKQVEERRLLRHLESSTGKLSEILQVERELSRVRGEIEQLQGRIRVLSNLSSLTTVTLTLREIKNYVPPKPPTFATELSRSFLGSLDALGQALKALLFTIVALLPWLVAGAIVLLPLRAWLRRRNS
jgi:hypothetical protein